MYYLSMNEFAACPTEGAIGLLAQLIKSGRLAESHLDCALGSVNLTFVKWRALDNLTKAESAVALKLLPEALNCVKSNITQLVDKLEGDGFVQRIADPEDRRGTLIELTGAGRDAHAAGRLALESATRQLFSGFTEEDRGVLRRLLSRLQTCPHS
jgi:DNA-binding MarR family transcriptional regulator